jgi:hypothetical protein|tara:strand:- start:1693 stop:2127 length:435 start_codon:yes stop_codon:yes gene_type:complete
MKHLIIALTLLATLAFADNEVTYAEFLKPETVQIKGQETTVLVAHAWLEVNDAHLDVKIPAARILQRWHIVSEDVALRAFTDKVIDLDGPTSLIMMSARDFNGGRKLWTTADDLHDWATEMVPFGYNFNDLLTDAQAGALHDYQ